MGGLTAVFIDLSDKVASRLPLFVGAVVGLSFLLLMVVFRSVLVPLKAALMNLLSIGAAYGVVVAVFQWGWGKSLIGLEETVPIVSFVPMFMFAVLFGLSMDYEVFLLSRIREEHLDGRDNRTSVINGISSTARVITSAALIMICVFAGFVLGPQPIVKMFGVGLADRRPGRRHDRAGHPRAGDDAAAGRGQLVDAPLARPPAAEPRHRGHQRPARARDAPAAGATPAAVANPDRVPASVG